MGLFDKILYGTGLLLISSDPDSVGSVDPDPGKMLEGSARCSIFGELEAFSVRSMEVLGELRINVFQFFETKKLIFRFWS
jgi:hypothetical protein